MRNRSPLLLLLFFISGGCGLIYEVVWTRLFIVVIGNTVFSVSAILTVFMAGLALGSRLAGRLIDRRAIPLIRTYAALEAGIGIYNLALPLLLKAANPLFGALYAASYTSFIAISFGRLLIAVALLIIPATMMGATLPILIRFYVENIESAGSQAGRVYTANTWGAAVGTALAGFVLVPMLGVNVTLLATVGANLLIAGAAWSLSRTHDTTSTVSEAAEQTAGPRVILIAMWLSGFAALIDEVAWTRVLGLVVGPTTYAFTLMLTSMIAGLGLGAALGSKISSRRQLTTTAFVWIEVAVGVASLAVVPLFGRMPVWIGQIVTKYVESFASIQAIEFAIFFGVMLVPTTLLGMTFPIAARLYAKSNSLLGSEVSAIYAFNTVGGILGSLVAGFLLIPYVGSQWALLIAASINALAGLVLAPAPRRWIPAVATAAIVALTFVVPRWDPELMTSGAYKYAPYYATNLDMESMLKIGDLVYFKEGATTTVTVRKHRGSVALAIDGKVDATDSGDMTTQKMLGHLPMLLSADAKNVAIIGLGSGVTAGAALQYPIASLDAVEISPEVVEASDAFKHVNHDVTRDKRTQMIVGDGRNHLRYVRKQYDVIVSEPSNPWMSGMASLFSREFFQEALARLTPRGIHCQWFHSYNMSTDDLRTVIATFRSVFPHAQLWPLNQNDLLLLGSPSKIEVTEAVLRRNFEQAAADLKIIGLVDLYSVGSLYMLEDEDLDAFAAGAALNTDSHPVLEFHAPRFIYANTSDANWESLKRVNKKVAPPPFVTQLIQSASAENHRNKAEMFLTSESYKDAFIELSAALRANPDDRRAWDGLLKASKYAFERPEINQLVEGLLTSNGNSSVVRTAAAEYFAQANTSQRAIDLLKSVLAAEPKNIKALEQLAAVYANAGSTDLAGVADQLLAIDPDNAVGLYQTAMIRFYQSRHDEAIQLVKRSLAKDPTNARAENLLAILYGQTFQHDMAAAQFRKSIEHFPTDHLSYNNYGLYLLERGRFDDAIAQFQKAIDINAENLQGFVGLGEAYRMSGRVAEANRWYRAALRLNPDEPVAKQYAK